MFYCEKCRDERAWPKSTVISTGKCELCGNHRVCYDLPSSHLTAKVQEEVDTVQLEIYRLCNSPGQRELSDIADYATHDKRVIFQEMGWGVNHVITEGDVRCVLSAIRAVADKYLKERAPK